LDGRENEDDFMEAIPQGNEDCQEERGKDSKEDDFPSQPPSPSKISKEGEESLVLTSEKRQNIYECDYCHQDISQQPRIRCAVCSDFDLCLDCFATSDHQAMIARIKAASHMQNELVKDGIDSTNIVGVTISSAAANHDSSHGYRVCDSTRYPVFATGRVAPKPAFSTAVASSVKSSASSVSKGLDNDDDDDDNDEQEKEVNGDKDSDDAMDVDYDEKEEKGPKGVQDDGAKSTVSSNYATSNVDAVSVVSEVHLSEDPKFIWTAEEDLRLIDAIRTHGLGNWIDISEAISGNGSVGKTPKRCMERYFDDFLGRYGHILPPWTAVDDDHEGAAVGGDEDAQQDRTTNEQPESETNVATVLDTPAKSMGGDEEEAVRSSKRQRTATSRMSAGLLAQASILGARSRKKLKVVPTESLPNYENIWPKPYLPPTGVEMGQEVARDLSSKAELAFVKATLAASSKEEADKIRKDWEDNRMGKIGSPTVLPPRPEDSIHLPGSELAGFMPRRGDFDVEWGNDAEQALADMEFTRADTPQERQLKMQVLDIYCQKLDEREKRKNFILSRHLYDYRKYIEDDQKLPQDERDLVSRMRMFERFHTPEEHKQFITDILKAKQLRKEIAKLQMYRRIGIRSLAEAEKYELDKNRRQFHKMAQLQREADAKAKAGGSSAPALKSDESAGGIGPLSSVEHSQRVPTDSLWKKYRTNDRKSRRNSSRSAASSEDGTQSDAKTAEATDRKKDGQEAAEAESTETDDVKARTPVRANKTEQKEEGEKSEPQCDTSQEKSVRESKDKDSDDFDITNSRGIDLLSMKERKFCQSLKIYPVQYLEIKKALIYEAMMKGMLDGPSSGPGRRTIVKIDVHRRGNIIDFLVRAGWISKKLGDVAKRVVTPPPVIAEPETKTPEAESKEDAQTTAQEDTEMKID
jgi:Myb-like DNA-binding domain/Zinc finger, ZZ type